MTAHVEFYVLKSAAIRQRHLFACRLIQDSYRRNETVLVLTEDAALTREFDELLWTFDDLSFIPHEARESDAQADPSTPVRVSANAETTQHFDLLINLSNQPTTQLVHFERIVEIVDDDAVRKRISRERFKSYRSQQVNLTTHQVET